VDDDERLGVGEADPAVHVLPEWLLGPGAPGAAVGSVVDLERARLSQGRDPGAVGAEIDAQALLPEAARWEERVARRDLPGA
jgi:hypothetical protein